MLRIKADRMNELEKFGFEKVSQKHNLVFRHCSKYDCNKYVLITVNTKTRELNINTPMGTAAFPEVYNEEYQDLIKADMVEEVACGKWVYCCEENCPLRTKQEIMDM